MQDPDLVQQQKMTEINSEAIQNEFQKLDHQNNNDPSNIDDALAQYNQDHALDDNNDIQLEDLLMEAEQQ